MPKGVIPKGVIPKGNIGEIKKALSQKGTSVK